MQRRPTIWFPITTLLVCLVGGQMPAQDVVFLRKSSGDGETKRKGEIVGWTGDTISIKGKTGVKDFDTERLVRFETAWHPGYDEGNKLLMAYRYDEAISHFDSALAGETRGWMQNIVHAKLVQCHLAKEDFENAARHFLKVVDDDPQGRFRHLVPLVWTSSRPNQEQLKRAESLLGSSEPMVALLGASWMLTEKGGEGARAKMDKLSKDFDPTVAALAKAQLWRLDKVAPNEKRLAIRIEQVRKMPENVRAGAWYLIADAQSKSKREAEAIVNFMRIPINDPGQGTLAAAALYQAAWLLEKTEQNQQAQALRNELKEKFGDTVWAR
jgi:tetratricopeptide (TPR) repeat protein